MKIAVLILLFLIPVSMTANELPHGIKIKTVLIENDFSTNNVGSKPWSVRFGKWYTDNGELFSKPIEEQKHGPTMSLYSKIPENHMLSFDFKITKGGGVTVGLYAKSALKFILKDSFARFSVTSKKNKEENPGTVDSQKFEFEAGKKYHIDIIISDSKVLALLDGKQFISAAHPNINNSPKRYLFTMSSSCSFDNVKLSEIELDKKSYSQIDFKTGEKK